METGDPAKAIAAGKPSRRGTLSVPTVLLLFIASILIGGGLTYGLVALGRGNQTPVKPITLHVASSATATATPQGSPSGSPTTNQLPTPTSFQKATSTALGFSMQYPSDWIQDSTQTTQAGNRSIIFHPQQQIPVYMSVGQISAANSAQITNTGDVNQANIDGFGQGNGLTNPQPVANSPNKRVIGNTSWDEQDMQFSDSSGEAIHVVSLTVKHTQFYYNILYFAPSSVYDEAMQKYYNQMLNSFLFLG